jgi:rod shape-determining protein MreD
MDERTPGIRPRPSLGRRLDAAFRHAFPAISTMLLLVLASAPLELPAQAELEQAVTVAPVFFWSLFRPAAMPPAVVFLIGLLTDLLGLTPLATSVMTLLIVHGLAMRWRRSLVRQGFLLVWLVFVGVAAGAAALDWALGSLLTFRLLPPAASVFQFALTAGFYPALATLLTHAHRTIADPTRA